MPILYKTVENSSLLTKAQAYGIKEYIRVKPNPEIENQFPFNCNYKFSECFLPKKFLTMADRINNFKVRADDVFILSFPKSGTMWTLNIVWHLMNKLCFSNEFINDQFYSMELALQMDINEENYNNTEYRALIEKWDKSLDEKEFQASPRLLKSHLPPYLLPKEIWTVKPKLIYVHRDIEDVAISMYHMFRSHRFYQYRGTLDDFLDAFLHDHIFYGPHRAHIDSFRQLSKLDNILFLKYEEMVADPLTSIKRISKFLNYSYSDDQLKQLTEHVTFQNMRNCNESNAASIGFNFFRKGKVGGYRDEMSTEYIQKFEEYKRQT